jgi:hypothetical protein
MWRDNAVATDSRLPSHFFSSRSATKALHTFLISATSSLSHAPLSESADTLSEHKLLNYQ